MASEPKPQSGPAPSGSPPVARQSRRVTRKAYFILINAGLVAVFAWALVIHDVGVREFLVVAPVTAVIANLWAWLRTRKWQ